MWFGGQVYKETKTYLYQFLEVEVEDTESIWFVVFSGVRTKTNITFCLILFV